MYAKLHVYILPRCCIIVYLFISKYILNKAMLEELKIYINLFIQLYSRQRLTNEPFSHYHCQDTLQSGSKLYTVINIDIDH